MVTRTHMYYMTKGRKGSDQVCDTKMKQKASTRLVLNSQVNVPSWFNRIVRGHGFSSGPVKKSQTSGDDLKEISKRRPLFIRQEKAGDDSDEKASN